MKYYVDYNDVHGDLCHVWVDADSTQDAIDQARDEYCDILDIIDVHL